MKFVITLTLILLGCCVKAQHPNLVLEHTINGYAQGTTYNIKYFSDKTIAKESVDSILNVIDLSMSIYKTDSRISIFNDPNTKSIVMDQHMKNVLFESLNIYKLTKGYFDITILPLVNLWGFGNRGAKKNPTTAEIEETKSLVGMNNLILKGDKLKKNKKNIAIDVNGIAQGYTVDVLSDYFLDQGISNFIIELGGEIFAHGSKLSGDFIVEIQRPYSSKENESYKVILKNKGITTSGNYEKRRYIGGKFISHHIDPKTGYPVENQTVSVTVVAGSAFKADAIDNYLMFLKPDEAIQFIENQKDMEAYIVYSENNILKELESSGFNNYIYK